MSHAKDWRSFPPAFVALIRSAAVKRIEIDLIEPKEAKRMEGKLHAFIGTLHRAHERDKGKDKDLDELDNLARRVQIKAKLGVLVCVPRELEDDNLLIQRALDAAAGGNTGPIDDLELVKMSPEMTKMFAQTLTTTKSAL